MGLKEIKSINRPMAVMPVNNRENKELFYLGVVHRTEIYGLFDHTLKDHTLLGTTRWNGKRVFRQDNVIVSLRH